MFNEDLTVFFTDFAESVIYSSTTTSAQTKAILDHDVELVGYESDISVIATTVTTYSSNNVSIGGIFKFETDSYKVDAIISNDRSLIVASVVKQ